MINNHLITGVLQFILELPTHECWKDNSFIILQNLFEVWT